MGYILWFYEKYCAKIHLPIEIGLMVIAVVFIHFAMAYVKDAANSSGFSAAQFEHRQTHNTSTATATGNGSIAISGNGNSVNVHGSKEQNSKDESAASK